MGNTLTGLSPSQILPIEHYLEHHLPPQIWAQSTLKAHLGSTRFMKVARIVHEQERDLVVKIFVVPEKQNETVELAKYVRKVREITARLQCPPNCLPWAHVQLGEKAGFLIRQFISRSLYDRLSTRPFLTFIEKKWVAFQLVQALVTIHDQGIVHGDLKCENLLLTRDDWLLLSDLRFQLKCRSFQVSDQQNKINKMICHPVRSSHVALTLDGNNDCGIFSLESGLRELGLWASSTPPLSNERDPQGYNMKAIQFASDGSALFSGGTDRRIRAWSLADPTKSTIIAQAASDQADGLRHDVTYRERKLEGVILLQEDRKVRRIAQEESDWGLTGPPQGHWDLISSLNVLDKLLVSSSRDGVIKVWK